MGGIPQCPDAQCLESFLLGQNAGAEAEALEQHLEQCDSCLATLQSLHAEDSVVLSLRSGSGIVEEVGREAVQRLAERLKGLWPAGVAGHGEGPGGIYDILAPAQEANELGRLGPYRVRKVLGAGGMGVVFQAYDPNLYRLVALKAMLPAVAATPLARERFLREAQAAAALKHDHIVAIYQVGEDRGIPFLAMEYLEGEALDQRLKGERLPLTDVLRIGRETAQALAAAHQRGLIHRDVKPGNIWLEQTLSSPSYRVKMLDFGLVRPAVDNAHLTRSGTVVGTPAFMAPEQLHGQALDGRSDLFSLGCVLYRMATGELPFKGPDMIAIGVAIATENPRPPQELNPELPPAVCHLVMRLLAKNAEDRPPSAAAVVETLQAIEQGQVRAARRRFSRRAWLSVAAVLLGLLGLGLTLFGPTVVRYVSNEGELVIEIDDPRVQAVVDQAGVTIHDRARDREYKVKVGRHDLKTGDYVLEVTEVGGDLRLFTSAFTIHRGGKTSIRVTLDPKALSSKSAVRAVSWMGKGPKQFFADPAHGLKDILDFRDVAGASAKELRAWHAALPPGFRMSFLASRRETGTPFFDAVAVQEKNPPRCRFHPEMTRDEGDRTYDRLRADGFRPLALCWDARPGRTVRRTQLWVKDGVAFRTWFGGLQGMRAALAEAKSKEFRLIDVDAALTSEGPLFTPIVASDQGRPCEPFYALSAADLLSTVEFYKRKGWRPDVLSAHWDGRSFRFVLVVVDNSDHIDWRFQMDMTLQEYRKESAERKRQGLFPLTVASHGEGGDVRYAAIWVRYR